MSNRLLTINIRRYLVTQPRTKRINKAVRYIRDRVAHYTKVKPEDVKLSGELNSLIFKRYAKSMERVKLNVSIEGSKALASPFAAQQPARPEPAKKDVAVKGEVPAKASEKEGKRADKAVIGKKEQRAAVKTPAPVGVAVEKGAAQKPK